MSVSEISASVGTKSVSAAGPIVNASSKETVSQPRVEPVDPAPATRPREADDAKELEQALNERISRYLSTNVRLQIDKDRDTGHFVYKSIDSQTGELHKQFPAEDILRMLAFFRELDGLLYDQEA